MYVVPQSTDTQFLARYTCKVYTVYCGTSEIEHGLCACTVDNHLAKARGLSPYRRTNHALSLTCTTFHRYPIFSKRYSVLCKFYTGYCGTSEIEHGLCACTVDNPLAKARGLSLRTGAQTMLYLSLDVYVFVYFSKGSIVCKVEPVIKWIYLSNAGIENEQNMTEIFMQNIEANKQNLTTSKGAINYEGFLKNTTAILGKRWLNKV